MCFRYRIFAACLAALVLGTSCQKSSSARKSPPTDLPPLAPDTVLRVHWQGKRQLSVEGSAYYFNRVWDRPESRQLEARTLRQLASAPWRLLQGEAAASNAPAALMLPVLDCVRMHETYLEIRAGTNHPFELVLAMQLPAYKADVCQSNLAIIVHSLTGFYPVAGRGSLHGWNIVHPQARARLELARVRDWLVFGIAKEENALMNELLGQLKSDSIRFESQSTSTWLSVDADLNWLAKALGVLTNGLGELPSLSAMVTGDGGHVLTDCTLTFSQPLLTNLPPWKIPTAVIPKSATGFSAIRGIQPLLSRSALWNDLSVGETPSQACFWSQRGNPFQIYLATPMPNANAAMDALTESLFNKVNPWLQAHGPRVNGQECPLFEKLPGGHGVHWGNMEGLKPFVLPISVGDGEFLVAGLFPAGNSQGPAGLPAEVKEEISGSTNLVYVGWEDTSSRLNDWLPVLQTTRALAGLAPLPTDCLSLTWLSSLQSRVGETQTTINLAGPNELKLHRESTLGFSALELHLIADWLESPQFPRGLYTFLGNPAPAQ